MYLTPGVGQEEVKEKWGDLKEQGVKNAVQENVNVSRNHVHSIQSVSKSVLRIRSPWVTRIR